MKTKNIFCLVLLILCASSNGQVPDSLKFTSLPPADFQNAYHIGKNALLIDVREFFEYKKSRIDHAINIPSSSNLDLPADTLNKESPLFLYCTTGFRSKRVARRLYDKGFTKIYNLDGGINEWSKQGLPINRKKIRKSTAR